MRYILVAAIIGLFGGQSHFGAVAYLLYILTIFLTIASTKRIFLTNSLSYNIGAAVILLSVTIATLLNTSVLSGRYLILMLGSVLLYPLFPDANISRKHYKYVIWFILLAALPHFYGDKPGYHTFWANPNNYASTLVCMSYFLLLPTGRKFWLQALIMGATFFAIANLDSRSVLAAYAAFVLMFIGQKYILRTVFRKRLLLIIASLIFAYVTVITDDRFQILAAVQDANIGNKGYNGLSFRDVLFFTSMDIISAHPFGVGMGSAGYYIEDALGVSLSPHNAFLKMTVEGGIGTLVGYLVILVGAILKLRSPLASSIFVAILIRCLFESATPFTGSIVSAMLLLPFFFNEYSLSPAYRGEETDAIEDNAENRASGTGTPALGLV